MPRLFCGIGLSQNKASDVSNTTNNVAYDGFSRKFEIKEMSKFERS
jgi:hypothetical protein